MPVKELIDFFFYKEEEMIDLKYYDPQDVNIDPDNRIYDLRERFDITKPNPFGGSPLPDKICDGAGHYVRCPYYLIEVTASDIIYAIIKLNDRYIDTQLTYNLFVLTFCIIKFRINFYYKVYYAYFLDRSGNSFNITKEVCNLIILSNRRTPKIISTPHRIAFILKVLEIGILITSLLTIIFSYYSFLFFINLSGLLVQFLLVKYMLKKKRELQLEFPRILEVGYFKIPFLG